MFQSIHKLGHQEQGDWEDLMPDVHCPFTMRNEVQRAYGDQSVTSCVISKSGLFKSRVI
jgi:hypothetical protein